MVGAGASRLKSAEPPLRNSSRGADEARACGGDCCCVDEGVGELLGGCGEGWRLGAVGRGSSSGIGILLKCTERLDGGVYAFRGGSSSLMRCSPAAGCESYTTYWCKSSESTPALTSAESDEMSDTVQGRRKGEGSHPVCASTASRVRRLAGLWGRQWVNQSEQ
jgi:hypothetical protein